MNLAAQRHARRRRRPGSGNFKYHLADLGGRTDPHARPVDVFGDEEGEGPGRQHQRGVHGRIREESDVVQGVVGWARLQVRAQCDVDALPSLQDALDVEVAAVALEAAPFGRVGQKGLHQGVAAFPAKIDAAVGSAGNEGAEEFLGHDQLRVKGTVTPQIFQPIDNHQILIAEEMHDLQ